MFHTLRLRIAVVGAGGAGTTAAWLLDPVHDVALYERADTLGGNAHTVHVRIDGLTVPVDDGAAWFSDPLYPRMLRLLEIVGVATRRVGMTWGFRDVRRGRPLLLPPDGLLGLARLIGRTTWLPDLVRLEGAIRAAGALVAERQTEWTWEDFVSRHRLSRAFARDVLTPIVGGAWGAPTARVPEMSAYTLLKYIVLHRPGTLAPFGWHVIRDGVASYVERVADDLRPGVVRRSTPVTSVRLDGDEWRVSAGGHEERFDRVVLAVGPAVARRLLARDDRLAAVHDVLDRFEVYTTRVATHSDPAWMPPRRDDWCVANLRYDGRDTRMTIWAKRPWGLPLFTTPVGTGPLPARSHHVSAFELPLLTPSHHRAQRALENVQGSAGLFFAGDWTRDIGSHEDAITSAMDAAASLAPDSARLELLRSPRQVADGVALGDPTEEVA